MSDRKDKRAISRVQALRIIKAGMEAVDIPGSAGGHVLRKCFGYFAWKSGVLAIIMMDIFNHSSFEATRRYLGIQQDDRDKVYLQMAIF